MAAVDRATLVSYFVAGAEPTAAQFSTLFDSNLNLTDGGTVAGATALTGVLSLGNKSQAAGVLTSKLDTGVLNAPTVFTTPAPAATQTAGAFTLTAAMFANGSIVGTANHATTSTVTMPAKSVFVTLFGTNITVGDSFIYRIHNAGTSVNEPLVWTGATGSTLIGQIGIGANTATGEASEELGTSTGTFMCRLTVTDGTTIHYRLS